MESHTQVKKKKKAKLNLRWKSLANELKHLVTIVPEALLA